MGLILITILSLGLVLGGTWASPAEEKLITSLLANYGANSIPVARYRDVLTVNLTISPITIDDVDIDDNEVTLHGWLQYRWKDAQLQWNESAHDGINVVHLSLENLWKPDIKLYNGLEADVDNTLALVYSTGAVLWVPPMSAQVSCNLSATWFPFDVQRCNLKYGSWTYDKTKIDLQPYITPYDSDDFRASSEWNLLSMTVNREEKKYPCCEELYPSIDITLTLRRKACHHVIEHVLPLVTIVTLGLLTMMIPATRADIRLLIVTLLLGSSLLHLRLADGVPQSMSILTLLNGSFVFVLAGLFVCNCVHMSILRGQTNCSFLAKWSKLVGESPASSDKSESLISDVEQRYHRTLDSVFTVPLAFIAVLSTLLFLVVPLF